MREEKKRNSKRIVKRYKANKIKWKSEAIQKMALTKIKKKLHIPTNWWNNETNWKISLYGLWSFRSVPKIVERKVLSLILHSPAVVTFSRISHSFYGKVRFFGFTSSLLFSQRNGRTGNYANFTLAQVKFGASVTFPCWWDLDWISTLTSYHAQYFWSCPDYSAAAKWYFCLRKDKSRKISIFEIC